MGREPWEGKHAPKDFAFGLFIFILAGTVLCPAQSQKRLDVKVQYEDPIRNQHYPELVYWFVTPETLNSARYTQDIQHISRDTEFDFPFLTARNGVNFFTRPDAHEAVAGIVKEGHRNGLRVGATFELQGVDSFRKFMPEDEQTVVGDAEGPLDANGHGIIESDRKASFARASKNRVAASCCLSRDRGR